MSLPVVTKIELANLEFIASGKVRELYSLSPTSLLFIATDRISAYDVILTNGVPSKGALLTQLSDHWFSLLQKEIPSLKTHLISCSVPDMITDPHEKALLEGRCMQVRKLKTLPIESIVRGYITGSGWSEYKKSGTVHGIRMPTGLQESQRLDRAIWTPSTKAEQGEHDENISPDQARQLLGKEVANKVEALSLQIYETARSFAEQRGIIIADTKFEFALDDAGEVVLIDEVLTPDSSRFWAKSKYEVGRGQDSLDKQILRNWLTETGLKGKDGVAMPDDIVKKTRSAYVEAFETITGMKWDRLLESRSLS